MKFRFSDQQVKRSILLLVGLIGLCHLYLTFFGSVRGDDSGMQMMWMEDYSRLLSYGVFPPRWLPWMSGGLGSPAFYIYPPLSHLIGSIPSLFGFAPDGMGQFQFVQFIALVASAASCYFVLRRFNVSHISSAFGTLFYCFTAYRLVDIYIRSAIGEHVAFVFIPLVFLFCDELIGERSKSALRAAVLLALSFTGLVLSNIPTALCVIVVAGAYWVVRSIHTRSLSGIGYLAVAGALAFLLCAWYLLPANYTSAFVRLSHLDKVTSHHALIEIFDPVNRRIGIQPVVISILVIGCIVLLVRYKQGLRSRWTIIVLLCILLQMPIISDWLWTSSLLSLTQFSFRFTTILTFGLAILIAEGIENSRSRTYYGVMAICLTISLAMYLLYIKTDATTPLKNKMPITRDGVLEHTPIAGPADSLGAAQLNYKWQSLPFIVGQQSEISQSQPHYSGTGFSISYTSSMTQEANLHQFYWPLWEATIDRRSQLTLSADSNGIIKILLPQGEHYLRLELRKSNAEVIGEWLSLFGLIAAIGLWAAGSGRATKLKENA